jgi:hypothetical protein
VRIVKVEDRLKAFGFLSLGFSHIFSAIVQRYMFALDENSCFEKLYELSCRNVSETNEYLLYHTSLIQHLFSWRDEEKTSDIPYTLVPHSITAALATMKSSVQLCRGLLSFSLDEVELSVNSAVFSISLSLGIMELLGLDEHDFGKRVSSYPLYPVSEGRKICCTGEIKGENYHCRLTDGHGSEKLILFPLYPVQSL